MKRIHKTKMIAAVIMLMTMCSHVCAQNFPIGIVSVQDSVKSVQFGVISSVAPEGGHGVQLAGVSNTSAHLFNGLQLSGVSNITTGMNHGLQLSGILNVSSGMMRGFSAPRVCRLVSSTCRTTASATRLVWSTSTPRQILT